MRLQDLDEWQGLTRQMIVSHLNHTGWCWCSLIGSENMYLLKPAYIQLEVFGDFAGTIGRLAEIEGRTPQALLRDINPRMQDGWPSSEDLSFYRHWLVGIIGASKLEMLDSYVVGEWRATASFSVRCWPCDAAGNKVRWPEVATAVKP